MVDETLADCGWQEVVTLFRRVAQQEDIGYPDLTYHYDYPIRPGLLRDALLAILDLPVGIDGDLLRMFGRFKARSLDEFQTKVMRKAPKVLHTQIENGNTYFIRAENLRKTPLEHLIPLIDDQRREDILESIRNNWHHAALVAWVPYLAEDEEFRKILARKKIDIIESIRDDKVLVDAAVLLKRFAWPREDPAVIEAIRDRIEDESKEIAYCLLQTLRELDMFRKHSELRDALDRYSDEMKGFVLRM
jgi:hypothetical protein